jgi:phage terminase large subunit-like protein
LLDWQVFFIAQIFGWKRASGLRRFREAWLSVARKNAKSWLLAGIGLFMLICDGEPHAEVYSVACKRDQAKIPHRQAIEMVLRNPELAAHCKRFVASISVEDTLSFFQPLSSDARTLDGLNVACALVDEVHEHPSRDVWDRVEGGCVGRAQPLMVAATTAGFDRQSFCYEKQEAFERLLTGVIEADDKLCFIAQMDEEDDYRDERLWIKSNPSLGTIVRPEALRAQIAEIEETPSKLQSFLRFHANQWVSLVAGRSLPLDRIEACGTPGDPRKLREDFLAAHANERCFGGFDLGLISDLTCFVLLFQDGERVTAVPWFWLPQDNLQQKEKLWRVPLSMWVEQGFIQLQQDDMIDVNLVEADLVQLFDTFRCKDCGFDPWNSRVLMSRMTANKVAQCTEIPQHQGYLSIPCKEFKTAVIRGTFETLRNPVLVWMMSNVRLEENDRGGMVPEKSDGSERGKIDAVQAIVCAWQRMIDPGNQQRTWDGNVVCI